MGRNEDHPFFIYYPMALVHDPFIPTPLSKNRESKDRQRNFADMVKYMDRCVGRLTACLDSVDLRHNTLVIFTSDNGTHRSIASEMVSGPIRGDKGIPTDAGTHVPLLVDWPANGARGTVCDDLIDFSDFLPTLAQVADVESKALPHPLDGRSFLPQIAGQPGDPREWIFCDYNPKWGKRQPARFARDKRWKLYSDGRLFDIAADPGEKSPITDIDSDPEAMAAQRKLQKVLDQYEMETTGTPASRSER